MKINAEYYLKVISVLFLISMSHINSVSFGLLKKNYKKFNKEPTHQDPNANQEPIKEGTNISKGSIKFQGWVKYLHYGDSDAKKPKAFFKNVQFEMQKRNPAATQKQSDAVILFI